MLSDLDEPVSHSRLDDRRLLGALRRRIRRIFDTLLVFREFCSSGCVCLDGVVVAVMVAATVVAATVVVLVEPQWV